MRVKAIRQITKTGWTSIILSSNVHTKYYFSLLYRMVTGVLNLNGNNIVASIRVIPRVNMQNVHTTIPFHKISSPDFNYLTCLGCFGWWTLCRPSLKWCYLSHLHRGTGRFTKRMCRFSHSLHLCTKLSGINSKINNNKEIQNLTKYQKPTKLYMRLNK